VKYIFPILLGVCYLCFAPKSHAQKVELGFYGGAATYYGDLNPHFSFRHFGPSLGVLARRNIDGRVCIRFNASYGYLWADDAKSPSAFANARNLRFFSHTFEGALVTEFNFQDFNGGTRDDAFVSPYLLAGVGLSHFNPKAEYKGGIYPLRSMGTEGQPRGQEYSLITPIVMLGGGIKFKLDVHWSLNVEVAYRASFTDYLDDVSGVYADYRTVAGHHGDAAAGLSDRSLEVGDVRIGRPGHQRGDSKTRDGYLLATVGLSYRFMPLICPAY
jgi:hypothetical protein